MRILHCFTMILFEQPVCMFVCICGIPVGKPAQFGTTPDAGSCFGHKKRPRARNGSRPLPGGKPAQFGTTPDAGICFGHKKRPRARNGSRPLPGAGGDAICTHITTRSSGVFAPGSCADTTLSATIRASARHWCCILQHLRRCGLSVRTVTRNTLRFWPPGNRGLSGAPEKNAQDFHCTRREQQRGRRIKTSRAAMMGNALTACLYASTILGLDKPRICDIMIVTKRYYLTKHKTRKAILCSYGIGTD